jgi:hypothetical protein
VAGVIAHVDLRNEGESTVYHSGLVLSILSLPPYASLGRHDRVCWLHRRRVVLREPPNEMSQGRVFETGAETRIGATFQWVNYHDTWNLDRTPAWESR